MRISVEEASLGCTADQQEILSRKKGLIVWAMEIGEYLLTVEQDYRRLTYRVGDTAPGMGRFIAIQDTYLRARPCVNLGGGV